MSNGAATPAWRVTRSRSTGYSGSDYALCVLATGLIALGSCVVGTLLALPLLVVGGKTFGRVRKALLRRWPALLREDVLGRVEPGSRVIDAAAGDCTLAWAMLKLRRCDVTAVDVWNRNETTAPFVCASCEALPFADNSADCVVMSYALHHLSDPRQALIEARRVARGKVIVVEDHLPFGRRFFEWGHHRMFHPLVRVRGPIAYRYSREWLDLFNECGLETVEVVSRWRGLSLPMKRLLIVLRPATRAEA